MARRGRQNRHRPVPRLETRLALLGVVAAAAFVLLAGRLYYLQILQHSYLSHLADRNRIRLRRIRAPRGLVFDRRHRPLVDTRPSFDAVVVPEDAYDLKATIGRLRRYLGSDGIAQRLAAAARQGRSPYQPVTVKERLTWRQVVALEAHQLELAGVSLEIAPARHYIYGSLAAHLLGYVGEVTRADLKREKSYRMGDRIGKFGVERGWDSVLRGQSGREEIEVDAVGRQLRVLRKVPDRSGASVVLTIDLDLQQAAERALGSKAGALVALDPNNGEILAMVSHPAFNPDLFGAGVRPEEWHRLVIDPSHPLQDRAIQGIYPPGSTFKLVDTIAAMEEGALSAATTYSCPGGLWFGGRVYKCWRKAGHGRVGLHRALVESCDVFFYHVGIKTGIDRIAHWAELLGLGGPTGIRLGDESAGVIPSAAWKQRRFHERWYPAETLSVAIGQGYVAVTPLQMAQLTALIANGGTRYRPRFVSRIEGPDGRVSKVYSPVVESRVQIRPEVLKLVRDAMADVVNSPHGTGRRARLKGITVCGKTGTAQVVKSSAFDQGEKTPKRFRDHGWFVAFAPRENPRIAIACVIEHGGHGGSAAAPVVHDVLKRFFELNPLDHQKPREVATIRPRSSPAGRRGRGGRKPSGLDTFDENRDDVD